MPKINKNIKEQFDLYHDLLYAVKEVQNEIILLEPKINNTHWLHGKSKVIHSSIDEATSLIVERSIRDNKYGIKLRCRALCDEPFFRFDSDGPAHRNDDPAIPLEEQSISTPHFNGFDKNGKSIAYKTDALKNEVEADIIVNDINMGVAHFCSTTNMCLRNSNMPTVIDQRPEFEFAARINDNFNGIKFD